MESPKPPQSAYVIDLLFLLLAPMHPALVMLAIVQYAVRRWSWICGGFLSILGVQELTPFWCIVFPGAVVFLGCDNTLDVTSSEAGEPPRTSTEPAEPGVVRADTDAERTSRTNESVPPIEPARHNYSRIELLTILAVQKDGEGKYLYSANKIADLVGGTRADSLNLISQVRGTKKEQPRTTGTTYRPKEGW